MLITRFGGPEVMEVVDLPDPTPGPGQQLYDVSSAGVSFADTHHRLSWNRLHRHAVREEEAAVEERMSHPPPRAR